MNGIKEYRIAIDHNLVGLERVSLSETQQQVLSSETIRDYRVGESISKAIAVNMGTKALQYVASNYEKFTGDSLTQDQINGAIEVFGLGAMALSGTTGLIAAGITLITKAVDRAVEVGKSRALSHNLQARLNITNTRSRY